MDDMRSVRLVVKIKISPWCMNRCREDSRSEVLKEAFQGHKPNTIRMYVGRLETLAKRLDVADTLCSRSDILSPWWLADPDHVVKILRQQNFISSTIKSYLTATTALLKYVSSTGDQEGDRAAARLLVGIYRSKHATMGT